MFCLNCGLLLTVTIINAEGRRDALDLLHAFAVNRAL